MLSLLGLTGVLWLLGFGILWRVPVCRLSPHSGPTPRTSVIIPARNEEENLSVLLPSLASQDLRPDEIWVVDDGSSDRTAIKARDLGARVLTAGALPPGWLGKPWACQQGADQAEGAILVFLDADCRMEPGGFRKLIDTFLRQPGVLSVSPYHRAETWGEQFSAFFNVMQAAGLNAFTVFGARLEPAGLFGPCVVVHKADYLRAGGHAAVKGQLLENFALARPLAAQGVRPVLAGGRGALSVRLYPGGLRDVIPGWAKSFTTGAGSTPPVILIAAVCWISGMIVTTAFFAQALMQGSPYVPHWLAAYALCAAQVQWQLRRLGSFRFYVAALFPVYLLFFLGVFAGAALTAGLTRKRKWKGRIISR